MKTETIDLARIEKLVDGSLQLKCFEVVKDATEFVAEGARCNTAGIATGVQP